MTHSWLMKSIRVCTAHNAITHNMSTFSLRQVKSLEEKMYVNEINVDHSINTAIICVYSPFCWSGKKICPTLASIIYKSYESLHISITLITYKDLRNGCVLYTNAYYTWSTTVKHFIRKEYTGNCLIINNYLRPKNIISVFLLTFLEKKSSRKVSNTI